METIAIMSTLKKPFSTLGTVYASPEIGTKPFIVPIFKNDEFSDTIRITNYGIEVSSKFDRLCEETQWILYIIGFFEYAVMVNHSDVTDALLYTFGDDSTVLQEDTITALVSQAILYHLNTKETIEINGKTLCIDLFEYDESDIVYDELYSIVISRNLMRQLNLVKCFGPSVNYKKMVELLEMKFKEISFFRDLTPLPNNIIMI